MFNGKRYNRENQRLSVSGEIRNGKLLIVWVTCSKKDQFCYKTAKDLHKYWRNKVEEFNLIFSERMQEIELKDDEKPLTIFRSWVRQNTYKKIFTDSNLRQGILIDAKVKQSITPIGVHYYPQLTYLINR